MSLILHVGDWIEHLHPRGPSGQFAVSSGAGAAQQRKAQLTEFHEHFHPHLPPELHGPPKPGVPFLILRLGRAGHESLTERDAGNSYGVAEHLAKVDDFEEAQGTGGTGDHINLYRVVTKHEAGPYEHLIDKRGGTYGEGVGYREHGKKGTPCAISVSFSQGGYEAKLLASIPLDHFRKRLKTHGYENFDDAGWKIGGEVIREVVGHHMSRQYGKHATQDDWVESKHPRGGHPENRGEFSKGSGSGQTMHVHVHREPGVVGGGGAAGAYQTEQSLYDDVDFDPERSKQFDPAPKEKGGALHIHVPHPGGATFASPNVHELPKMTPQHAMLTAQAGLATKRQQLFMQAAADVDHRLGIGPASEKPAIGAWKDGAEPTSVMIAPRATAGQLKLSAAMKGWLAHQKAVLAFTADAKGPGVLYTALARGELDDIHRALLAAGIENHTLVPATGGVTIYIADEDGSAAQHVSKYAVQQGLTFKTTKGRAEFIGAKHYEGTTDEQQRAEAQTEYEYVIAHSGVAGSSGIPARDLWRGIRDRWAQALLTTQDRRTIVHVHVGDQETHVFVEAQHPRRGKGPGGGEFAPKGEGGASGGAVPQRSFEPTMHVHVHQPPQPTPKPAGKPALTGSKGHPATISTALISAKTSPTNSNVTYTQTGLAAMKADHESFARSMHLLKSPEMYPYFRDLHGTPDQIAEQVISQMVQNLKFFAANAPPLTRRWGTAWYGEENKAAKAKAAETGLPLASVAGAYAALSPQNDWNMNVYQGDVVIDAVLHQQKTPWSDSMDKVADQIGRTALTRKMIDNVRGKRLEEIASPVEQAMWIRVWNEATSDRYHRLFRPDGKQGDWARKNDGGKQPATWKTLGAIANAIKSIKSGGDREIISEAMGGANKVRSFYNNILDPESANGDITVDTHAIGAALMDALGGSTAPVMHGLGMSPEADKKPPGWKAAPNPAKTGVAGLYGLHAEAYRRAAKDLGMRPLELQSLTWEAKRALFEHMPARAKQTISGIWRDYHNGQGTLQEAQRAVVAAAGGFKEPDWTRAPHDD